MRIRYIIRENIQSKEKELAYKLLDQFIEELTTVGIYDDDTGEHFRSKHEILKWYYDEFQSAEGDVYYLESYGIVKTLVDNIGLSTEISIDYVMEFLENKLNQGD